MKLLIISDSHFMYDTPIGRKDNILEAGMSKLKFVLDYARKNKCRILQAGDLFDIPRSWRLLSTVQKIFSEKNIDIYSVYGQHDTYMYSENSKPSTILGVLASAGYIHILCNEVVRIEGVNIYGCSYGGEVPKPSTKGINILVIHAPILEKKLWYGQTNFISAKQFLADNEEYDLIVCGDIHRKFQIKNGDRQIVNTGCILRIEADEYNLTYEPSFAVFDTDDLSIKWIVIPHRDAEEVISRKHILMKKQHEDMLDEFVNSIQSNAIQGTSFEDNLSQYLQVNEISKDVRNIISNVMEGKDGR